MNSPFAYIGGKSKLSEQIISFIPPDHETYCEVFSGAAWVFFRKPESNTEVINDLDSDLMTFYLVVKHHLREFIKEFEWLLPSREKFENWKDELETKKLTDIQRAARYYYIQRLAYGGKVRNRSYGVQTNGPPRINLLRIEQEMSDIHLRLANVHIENKTWRKFIPIYDKPHTFFYCDPPYYKCPDYKHNFTLEDFKALAATLKTISGKFMLSINDHPDIREVFQGFNHKEVSLLYTVSPKGPTEANELIYSNYELKEQKADLTLFPEV